MGYGRGHGEGEWYHVTKCRCPVQCMIGVVGRGASRLWSAQRACGQVCAATHVVLWELSDGEHVQKRRLSGRTVADDDELSPDLQGG